ncbi:MAG TPA: transporter substrate-binding domain-containing protein [Pantanalinema sp.]
MRARRFLLLPLSLLVLLLAASPCLALKVLTEQQPPLTFTRHGAPAGMAVEVVEEILARHHDPTPIQVVPWARGIKALTTQPGILLFTINLTPERKQLYTFIGPIARMHGTFYARRDSHLRLRTAEDARKVERIGVYAGTSYEKTLRKLGFTNLDVSPDPHSAARKLMRGRIDLWYEGNLSAPYTLKQVGYRPSDMRPLLALERDDVCLAFSRGTPAQVIRRWFATLRALQQDGTLARIQRRWLPSESVPRRLVITGVPPGTPMPPP